MERAAARSGPSTRMLEKGRSESCVLALEPLAEPDFSFIGRAVCQNRNDEQGGGIQRKGAEAQRKTERMGLILLQQLYAIESLRGIAQGGIRLARRTVGGRDVRWQIAPRG